MTQAQPKENAKNMKNATFHIKVALTSCVLAVTCFGLIPLKVGWTIFIFQIIGILLGALFSSKFMLIQHFNAFSYVTSPIWILYADPCANGVAIWHSIGGTALLSFGVREKKWRNFYLVLGLLSWIFVSLRSDSFICHSGKDRNLHNVNLAYTIIGFTLNVVTLCNFSDSMIRDTQASLDQVRELNKKFEALNQELKQLLEDKDNFILLFSHETRNPLNILLGNLSLLLDEADSPGVKSKLMRCKFCANLLLQYLNNVLDSGKISNTGVLEVTPIATKIHEYIQTTMSFMEMLVKKKERLRAELMIPQSLPTMLKFDPQRLTQVILNLLTNALKFTESGTISLVVRYLRKETLEDSDYYPTTTMGYKILEDQPGGENERSSIVEFPMNPLGTAVLTRKEFQRQIPNRFEKDQAVVLENHQKRGYLKIEISDTGCGMNQQELGALFRKFSQVHSEGSHRQIGTGLGLWITKILCTLMGGDIKVFSKPNLGTVFVAIIEADILPISNLSISLSSNSPSNTKIRQARRFLVVDDDPFNLEFHVRMLKGLGFESIETTSDGYKLLDKFKTNPEGYYDTIITDICMPRFSGIEAARVIREFEQTQSRRAKVNIGFITGHPNHNDKLACDSNPIDSLFYLSKPVNSNMIENFLLPTNNIAGTLVSNTSHRKSRKTYPTHDPLVLCVDDDVYNLDCLEQLFKPLGVQIIKANSGEEGLAKLKATMQEGLQTVSFILMDCRMPGLDGWETSREMKDFLSREGKISIPIIGVSGDGRRENEEKFKRSGMDDMLQKPVTREDLKILLTKYC